MAEHVAYYRIESGKNAGIVLTMGNWPEPVLKTLGCTPERMFHRRVATRAEHLLIRTTMRFKSWRYRTAEDLLEDEAKNLDMESLDALKRGLEVGGVEPCWEAHS